MNKTIGIIGYGNFGRVICRHFFPENPIILYTSKKDIQNLPQNIAITQSLEELAKQSNIIIPAVPIRTFEKVIKQLVPFLQPHHIVMDVCSVKEYPVAVMKKYVPAAIQSIAIHPMFGPAGIEKNNKNLRRLKLVIHNITANQNMYKEITEYFLKLGLILIEMTPEEHDKLAAQSHFFAKIICFLAHELNLHSTTIDTPAAATIFDALSQTTYDKQIMEDMIMYNRYCKEILERMIEKLRTL